MQRYTIPLTTSAGGDATGYSPTVTGKINSVIYTKPAVTPFDAGVDFTVTVESTGQTIWAQSDVNASASVSPMQAAHTTAGAAALFAAGGTAILVPIVVVSDRVKVVVAQGGNVKLGSVTVVFE